MADRKIRGTKTLYARGKNDKHIIVAKEFKREKTLTKPLTRTQIKRNFGLRVPRRNKR